MVDLFYTFEESGVGCEAHQDPDCLCDVKVGPSVPIVKAPRLAPVLDMSTNGANSFILWASMTLGRFEALSGINETVLNEALSLWEGRHNNRPDKGNGYRTKAASMCLKAGLTFEQTARWLSTEVPFLLDLFFPRERHEFILKIEPLIRARKTSRQIADELGIQPVYVVELARRWNVKLPHSGTRLDPALKVKARKMVKTGMSRRAVARALDISETRVSTWCRDLPAKYNGKVSK